MRRLLAAAGAAAVTLAVFVPVAARAAMPDGAHKLSFYQPAEYDRMTGNKKDLPATADDGAVIYSNDEVVTVAANFSGGDGVKSWDVVLRPTGGGTPSTCHEDLAPHGINVAKCISCSNLAVNIGVVDDGRKIVDGLDHCNIRR